MKAAVHQLTLDLPHRPALGAEDFLVSPSNAAAVDLIERWPDWPAAAAVVHGPAGSGKSHLVHVWQARSGAEQTTASAITEATIARLGHVRALAVEDIDRGIADERLLFHMLNLAREHSRTLLLTSRQAPGDIAVTLPDLRSRLRAMPAAGIEACDAALLKALLIKLFADRQVKVAPHVVDYLALHMERSAAAAPRLVAEADRLALARHSKVTRALAAEALARLGGEDG